jgi:hypothetical protein
MKTSNSLNKRQKKEDLFHIATKIQAVDSILANVANGAWPRGRLLRKLQGRHDRLVRDAYRLWRSIA